MLNDVTIIILAGGKSSRMGNDKGTLAISDTTFIDKLFQWVHKFSDHIYISVADHNKDQYRKYDKYIVQDVFENYGPLGGINSVIGKIQTKWFFVLSVDTPLVTSALLQALWINKKEYEAIFFEMNKRIQPLIGLYNSNTVSIWKNALENNELKVTQVVRKMNYKCVDVNKEDIRLLKNINTPEDYQWLLETER
jgi:molybdopterin-guanine dinucleotide biosynthesis protein A